MMYKINASKITPKLEDNAETALVGSGISVGSLFSVGVFAEEVRGRALVTALAVVVTDIEEAGAGTEDVTTSGSLHRSPVQHFISQDSKSPVLLKSLHTVKDKRYILTVFKSWSNHIYNQ